MYFFCISFSLYVHIPFLFKSVAVMQFQIQNWPASRTKPDSLLTILDIMNDVEKSGRQAEAKGPIVVHCE